MADIETLPANTRYFTEVAAPSTPSTGQGVLYAATDGTLHYLNDAASDIALGAGGGGGAVATDAIWDAAGDLAVGTGADTAARLALGASGTVPKSNGSTLAYSFPPGHEFAHAQITSNASITATVEASADTVVTAGAVTFDGSTDVVIEFYSPSTYPAGTAGATIVLWLFDGSTPSGALAAVKTPAAATMNVPVHAVRRLTPSAASHTYSVRATVSTGTGTVSAGNAGSGAYVPAFIRIIKAN